MDNIIVTSGGFNSINNYVSDENIELFKKISEGKKVIIIANAAPVGSGNYIARENVKENFLKVGATSCDIVDLDIDTVNKILDYDVIYFLEKGIYIGESAGSMILSKSVKYIYDLKKGTKPKYSVIYDSYEGFGLIDIYILPHYQKEDRMMDEKVKNYELENNIKLTKLNDGEIITYNYNKEGV